MSDRMSKIVRIDKTRERYDLAGKNHRIDDEGSFEPSPVSWNQFTKTPRRWSCVELE